MTQCAKHPRYSTYPFCPDCRTEEEVGGASPVDPIQKAVDDYLLMEAKARAWDIVLEDAKQGRGDEVADYMLSTLLKVQQEGFSKI